MNHIAYVTCKAKDIEERAKRAIVRARMEHVELDRQYASKITEQHASSWFRKLFRIPVVTIEEVLAQPMKWFDDTLLGRMDYHSMHIANNVLMNAARSLAICAGHAINQGGDDATMLVASIELERLLANS